MKSDMHAANQLPGSGSADLDDAPALAVNQKPDDVDNDSC